MNPDALSDTARAASYYSQMLAERRRANGLENRVSELTTKLEQRTKERDALLRIIADQ